MPHPKVIASTASSRSQCFKHNFSRPPQSPPKNPNPENKNKPHIDGILPLDPEQPHEALDVAPDQAHEQRPRQLELLLGRRLRRQCRRLRRPVALLLRQVRLALVRRLALRLLARLLRLDAVVDYLADLLNGRARVVESLYGEKQKERAMLLYRLCRFCCFIIPRASGMLFKVDGDAGLSFFFFFRGGDRLLRMAEARRGDLIWTVR